MTPNTQSVCKHCGESELNWRHGIPHIDAVTVDPYHPFEHMAELASTGEQQEIFRQLREEISLGSLLSWERNTGSVCTECRFCGEGVAYVTKECKHKSDCPYPHILKISQIANRGFVKFGGINSAIPAARPSEPSRGWVRIEDVERYLADKSVIKTMRQLAHPYPAAPQPSAARTVVPHFSDCDYNCSCGWKSDPDSHLGAVRD